MSRFPSPALATAALSSVAFVLRLVGIADPSTPPELTVLDGRSRAIDDFACFGVGGLGEILLDGPIDGASELLINGPDG